MPLTDATRGLLDAGRLAAMKPRAALINFGRGPIVATDYAVAPYQPSYAASRLTHHLARLVSEDGQVLGLLWFVRDIKGFSIESGAHDLPLRGARMLVADRRDQVLLAPRS